MYLGESASTFSLEGKFCSKGSDVTIGGRPGGVIGPEDSDFIIGGRPGGVMGSSENDTEFFEVESDSKISSGFFKLNDSILNIKYIYIFNIFQFIL